MTYTPVIGLEVHIELSTKSKMFCPCPADHFGKPPNTQTCPVCLGLPGALPFANQKAIEDTIKMGLALGMNIAERSKFDRKNYFYPDLPKAFQISQYDEPLCTRGLFMGKRITRIHLEEDTGKLVHTKVDGKTVSLVDYNRSGVPLVELVTEPDFSSTDEIAEFLKEIQLLVRYLGISTADMEKGSMRLEANISLTSDGALPDYKVELKNINSFRFLKKAVEAEIERQTNLLKSGSTPPQETRGYDDRTGVTFAQRSKEVASDYRYFPEPDLPPLRIDPKNAAPVKSLIPELPWDKRERFKKDYSLPHDYARVFVDDPVRADYFEEAAKIAVEHKVSPKLVANLMINQNLDRKYKEPAGVVKKIIEIQKNDYAPKDEVAEAVKKVVSSQEMAVADYKSGKAQVVGFLIGQVQKELEGKGEVKMVRKLLESALQK